ncbi:hypothetical protein FRC12_024446 [Ceratobasidium sp. 428]|nr:hypothetical protein FRC12_024446 [Ceratobasidium sp. 428]
MGTPVAANAQNPALSQAQVTIQGPNQVALDNVQHTPPVVVPTAVVDVPHVVPLNPLQPLVPAPGLAPIPVAIPPAADDNPIHPPVIRALYGFPGISAEEESDEGEDAQDGVDDGVQL